jgi:hypothetical protein
VNNLEISVNQLTKQLNDLQKTVDEMTRANKVVAVKVYDSDIPVYGSWGGMTGTFPLGDERSTCPPGSWMVGIQGFKIQGGVSGISGSVEPVSGLRYLCRGFK